MRGMAAALLSLLLAGWLAAAGLSFSAPAGWRSTPSSSSMRVAQFTLPRADGDAVDAELVIYYFGGSGGSVDANIQRWIGQMQQPDGKPASNVKRDTAHVNGLTVTLIDVSGTYVAETAPGAATHHNNAGYRLRAGVVETPSGPYYIKLTGPQKTVAKWEKAFADFIASMRVP
jgi:hypothetical protein